MNRHVAVSAALAATVALTVALFSAPASARAPHAETRRVAVLVGSNAGSDEQPPLRFAESDAGKLAAVLTELGGVEREDLILLQGRALGELQSALDTVASRVARWRQDPDTRVILLFYFSGHSDGQSLELGRQRYPFGELRRWLAATGADVRLAIIDACKSGALLAAKGGTRAPPFEIRIVGDADSTGEVLLTSSAADETALESREIRGSFFSHHLMSGLRGAADSSGDGQVTLAEAYQYAFAHTVSATANTLMGPQHPGYDYRLSGQGELVLTQLARPQAVIDAPAGFDRLLVVQPSRDLVVAELVSGSARRVAVEPGRYVLRAWRGGATYAAALTVAAGEARAVRADEMAAVPAALVAVKGVDLQSSPVAAEPRERPRLFAALGARRGIASELNALGALRLALRWPRGPVATLDLATGRGPDFRETRAEVLLGWGASRGRGPLRIFGAVEGGGGVVVQTPDRRPRRWSGAGVLAIAGGGAVRIGARVSLALEAEAPLALVRRDGDMAALFLPAAWLGVLVDL